MSHITDPIFEQTLSLFDLNEQATQPHMMLHVYHKSANGPACQGYRGNYDRPILTTEQKQAFATNVAADMQERNMAPDMLILTKPTYAALGLANPYPLLPTGYTVTVMVMDDNGTPNELMYIRKFAMHWDAGRLSEYLDTTATIDPLLVDLWNCFRAPTGAPDYSTYDAFLDKLDTHAAQLLTKTIQHAARSLADDPTNTPPDLVTTVHGLGDPDPANWRTNVAYFADPDLAAMIETACAALRKLEDKPMHIVITQHMDGKRLIFTAQTARANGCPFQEQATATYMIGLCGKLVLVDTPPGYNDPVASGMWHAYHGIKA